MLFNTMATFPQMNSCSFAGIQPLQIDALLSGSYYQPTGRTSYCYISHNKEENPLSPVLSLCAIFLLSRNCTQCLKQIDLWISLFSPLSEDSGSIFFLLVFWQMRKWRKPPRIPVRFMWLWQIKRCHRCVQASVITQQYMVHKGKNTDSQGNILADLIINT